MKTKGSLFCLFTVAVLMLTFLTGCDEIFSSSGRHTTTYYDRNDNVYTVMLEVTVKHNKVFSDYDVDIYSDGQYLGTLSDSETEVYTLYLQYGKHRFRFEKSGDSSMNTSVTVNVSHNDYFSYSVKRHNKLNGGIKVTKDT